MTRYVSHGACKSCGATGTEGLLRVVSEPETTWCCIESGTCLEVTDDDGSLFAGRPVWECTSCLNNLCSFCMPLSFTEQHRFLYGVENIVGRKVHLLKSFELNYDSSPPEIQFAERALITEARVLAAEMETLLLQVTSPTYTGHAWICSGWRGKLEVLAKEEINTAQLESMWNVTVSPRGHVSFYPVTPPVPPHQCDSWGAQWFLDADHATMAEAYWHSEYPEEGTRYTRPLLHAKFFGGIHFQCCEAVAALVHKGLRRTVSHTMDTFMRALDGEYAVLPSCDEPMPWDKCRVLMFSALSYMPSVIEVMHVIQEASACLHTQRPFGLATKTLPCWFPNAEVIALVASFLQQPAQWLAPVAHGRGICCRYNHLEIIPVMARRRLKVSAGALKAIALGISLLYAKCIETVVGHPIAHRGSDFVFMKSLFE